jgi:serine/threonine-protein kinase
MIENLGQYKILETLPAVPLGDLYRARDTRVGRTVAITVVADQIAADSGRRDQFIRAARAAAEVSHPNIVTLYEVGEEGDLLYLVNEFVQGDTLKTAIAGRPLNPRRAVDLAGQIAEGLADAHAADLVHGALTADAIVVTPKGHAKITGFGLARFSGVACTTAVREDLFALGVILFEMLTGRAPVPGAGVPSAANHLLPREIDPIVAKALGKSGGYEAAVTLAAELRAMGAVLDVRQDAQEAATSVVRSRRKSRRSSAEWMVLALVLTAIAVTAWLFFRRA